MHLVLFSIFFSLCLLADPGLDQISMCSSKSVEWTLFWVVGPTVLSQPGASHRENGGYANFDFDILICPRGIVLPDSPFGKPTRRVPLMMDRSHTLPSKYCSN